MAEQDEKSTEYVKLVSQLQKRLDSRYGTVYIPPVIAQYFTDNGIICESYKDLNFCSEEIRAIRFESEGTTFQDAVFTVYCGRDANETVFDGVQCNDLLNFLDGGFLKTGVIIGTQALRAGSPQPKLFIPIGDSNFDVAPDRCFAKSVMHGPPLPFYQGSGNVCLGYAVANTLSYLELQEAADTMAALSDDLSTLYADMQLAVVCDFFQKCVPGIINLGKKTSKAFSTTPKAMITTEMRKYELVVFVPQAGDGTNTHAVCYCNKMRFDATQRYPMKLCEETLSFIAGTPGFVGIWRARIFTFSNKLKKKIREI